ncbi:hypothetical protein VPHG_00121 [Vibrio phage 11895-B1]|uniref:hypothetical protein n=1 Tax=Vibrio phage 11895-B1 TaxID=754075 RepID=UPI0002C06C11|nr:hypothetical protein VPHG_00121 [Vibrio phage 11895-B1]AGH32188.1 hypothetical protein VPHG_00121 [Vibrio phage 11895-B1]
MTKITDMNNDELIQLLLSFPQGYELVSPDGDVFAKVSIMLKDNKYHHTEIKCVDTCGNVWYATEKDIEQFVHIDAISDMIVYVE